MQDTQTAKENKIGWPRLVKITNKPIAESMAIELNFQSKKEKPQHQIKTKPYQLSNPKKISMCITKSQIKPPTGPTIRKKKKSNSNGHVKQSRRPKTNQDQENIFGKHILQL